MSERHPVVYQRHLTKVYLDPLVCSQVRAYVPEQHASPRCARALPKGTPDMTPDPDGAWCDLCTTPHRRGATIRRTLTGRWRAA